MSEALYAIKFFTKIGDKVTGPCRALVYSTPKFGTPGKWHVIDKRRTISTCRCGFHVPFLESLQAWGKEYYFNINFNIIPYIVQLGGDCDYNSNSTWSKMACRRIRLIRELKGFRLNAEELKVLKKEYNLLTYFNLDDIISNGLVIDYKE